MQTSFSPSPHKSNLSGLDSAQTLFGVCKFCSVHVDWLGIVGECKLL